MSYMELKVRNWLDENNIEYEYQKRFKDYKANRCLPFDFYIPKYKIAIEIQGEQHYKPITFAGGIDAYKEFEKRKDYDMIKRQYCKNNDIELLEISYLDIKRKREGYKKILSNKLIKK